MKVCEDLRQAVLQAAIQGKLTKQLPEDGDAKDLLAEIRAEKEKLIKEGKLKKSKALPEINEDEIPFDIPENWQWVRLGELISFLGGVSYKKSDIASQGLRILRGGNIQNMKVTLYDDDVFLPLSYYDEDKNVKLGDIVIVASTGSKTVIGKPAYIDDLLTQTMIGAFLRICRPIDGKTGLFLKDIFESRYYREYIRDAVKGTNINNIKEKYITEFLIPLPPLAEQKRIVAKVDTLLSQIDDLEKTEAALEKLKAEFPADMKASLLQAAIQGKLTEQLAEDGTAAELLAEIKAEKEKLIKEGKLKKSKALPEIIEEEIPFDIPENWQWVRLDELGITNIGLTYRPTDISDKGTIVLRSSNIQDGKMDYNDIVKVNVQIPDNKMCAKGDILICARNGSKKLVGKAAIVDRDDMSFGAFMAIFKSRCNSYILHVINSSYFRYTLLGDASTTTINQITQNMLKTFLVPLPPLAEQKRIVAKLEQLLPLCDGLVEK